MFDISCTFISIFVVNCEDTFTRSDKYPSKLDIFRSLIRIFEVTSKVLSLAVKNIEVNFIFLARLFVSLHQTPLHMKILIIEDDLSFQEILRRTLEQERYIVEVAPDYRTGLIKLSDYMYDCILLDINLPDGNGLNLLREFKEMKKTGNLIVISARDSIEDKVEGLDLGADDYLAKPFHLAELLSRIKSVMRRNNQGGEQHLCFGNVKVNPHTFETWVGVQKVDLSRKEFDFLLYFMQRPNHLISKSMLAEAIWGDHFDDIDNYDFIYAQIKNLRKRLAAWGANIEIVAVYGMGYKLVET